jgi:hypothetical protein
MHANTGNDSASSQRSCAANAHKTCEGQPPSTRSACTHCIGAASSSSVEPRCVIWEALREPQPQRRRQRRLRVEAHAQAASLWRGGCLQRPHGQGRQAGRARGGVCERGSLLVVLLLLLLLVLLLLLLLAVRCYKPHTHTPACRVQIPGPTAHGTA